MPKFGGSNLSFGGMLLVGIYVFCELEARGVVSSGVYVFSEFEGMCCF